MDTVDAYLEHDAFRDPRATRSGTAGSRVCASGTRPATATDARHGGSCTGAFPRLRRVGDGGQRDRGPRRRALETTDFARGYSALDQYVMGFARARGCRRSSSSSAPTTSGPTAPYRASTAPEAGVTFTGSSGRLGSTSTLEEIPRTRRPPTGRVCAPSARPSAALPARPASEASRRRSPYRRLAREHASSPRRRRRAPRKCSAIPAVRVWGEVCSRSAPRPADPQHGHRPQVHDVHPCWSAIAWCMLRGHLAADQPQHREPGIEAGEDDHLAATMSGR